MKFCFERKWAKLSTTGQILTNILIFMNDGVHRVQHEQTTTSLQICYKTQPRSQPLSYRIDFKINITIARSAFSWKRGKDTQRRGKRWLWWTNNGVKSTFKQLLSGNIVASVDNNSVARQWLGLSRQAYSVLRATSRTGARDKLLIFPGPDNAAKLKRPFSRAYSRLDAPFCIIILRADEIPRNVG